MERRGPRHGCFCCFFGNYPGDSNITARVEADTIRCDPPKPSHHQCERAPTWLCLHPVLGNGSVMKLSLPLTQVTGGCRVVTKLSLPPPAQSASCTPGFSVGFLLQPPCLPSALGTLCYNGVEDRGREIGFATHGEPPTWRPQPETSLQPHFFLFSLHIPAPKPTLSAPFQLWLSQP